MLFKMHASLNGKVKSLKFPLVTEARTSVGIRHSISYSNTQVNGNASLKHCNTRMCTSVCVHRSVC